MRPILAALLFISLSTLAGTMPDPDLTPGAVETTDLAIVCRKGFSQSQRKKVHRKTLLAVSARYGIAWNPKCFELDHLVSLELGGAPDDVLNLWPQPRRACGKPHDTGPYAEDKDRLENALHRAVCAGRVPLSEAQLAISENWITALATYAASPKPSATTPAVSSAR